MDKNNLESIQFSREWWRFIAGAMNRAAAIFEEKAAELRRQHKSGADDAAGARNMRRFAARCAAEALKLKSPDDCTPE